MLHATTQNKILLLKIALLKTNRKFKQKTNVLT